MQTLTIYHQIERMTVMKNHIKLASLLLVVSILVFSFVGCQVKTKTPAVSPDVSSLSSDLSFDIISSSSDVSSASEVASSSSKSSVSSKTVQSVKPKVNTSVKVQTTVATATTTSSTDTTAKLAQEETRHQNKINEITNYYDTKIKQDSDKLAKAQDIYNKSSSSQPNNHDILQYKEELRSDTETKPKALAGEDQTYQTNIAKIKNQ